ncbi:MAG: response regulator [Coriobacteriales bacterium]|nr:response regulator [Coriobacteriales bacterium]
MGELNDITTNDDTTATAATNDKPIVLTIDDDPVILNSVLETLKTFYTVRPFTSGEAALKFLEHNHVDIILLDCNMEGMTGFDVLDVLQSKDAYKNIPVIFLTASINNSDEVRALEEGAADYLLKPFNSKALLARVRMQDDLHRYRNHLEEMVAEQTIQLHEAYDKLKKRERAILSLLAKVTEFRDHTTGEHVDRTTAYAEILADDLAEHHYVDYEIDYEQAQDIIDAVKLHDLGKLAIPDEVLLKPAKLTPAEFDVIKTHPDEGMKILRESVEQINEDSLLETAGDVIYSHHEKWDGTGYPDGLKGEEIPLSARIAAIADVYDALTTERPYKKAMSHEEAIQIIYSESGTHFDPHLIEIMKKHEGEFAKVAACKNASLAQDKGRDSDD